MCKNMEIRDFVANRSFSGNGLWQWYEKHVLARHTGGVGRRVRAAVGEKSLCNRNGIDHLNYPSPVTNKDRPRNVPWHCQRGPSLHGTLRGPSSPWRFARRRAGQIDHGPDNEYQDRFTNPTVSHRMLCGHYSDESNQQTDDPKASPFLWGFQL